MKLSGHLKRLIYKNLLLIYLAGIRDVIGGRSGSYEKVLRQAKEKAINEMVADAVSVGANAIVGIDFDYETIGANGSMIMVAASGTAVEL